MGAGHLGAPEFRKVSFKRHTHLRIYNLVVPDFFLENEAPAVMLAGNPDFPGE